MARPFRSELAELRATIQWASSTDIAGLTHAVARSASAPLVAVGSGGSLSAASYLARLHRRHFAQVAVASPPLPFVSDPIAQSAHHWIISAGGSNVDVISAFQACVNGEPAAINVLSMKTRSRLSQASRDTPSVEFHHAAIPSKKDGFLATNSLLGFCLVLGRAYNEVAGPGADWAKVESRLLDVVDDQSTWQLLWREAVNEVADVEHLIVLHDTDSDLGAVDLESKLTEAAIKNVQLADYRHFAHGRHHWLAKNGEKTGVLLLESDSGRRLAERTRRLIPGSIPVGTIDLGAAEDLAELTSLVAAYVITDQLGAAAGIDPGQPGVPEFGRKLYGLRLPSRPPAPPRLAAIQRKTRASALEFEPEYWENAYDSTIELHRRSSFGAIAFDFDGTLVDTRDRFDPIRTKVSSRLANLAEEGVQIGVATGRGGSAGDALRMAIPKELWPCIVVGYYNGAVIQTLDVCESPIADDVERSPMAGIVDQLERLTSGAAGVHLDVRPHQLTVTFDRPGAERRTWEAIEELLDTSDATGIRAVRSSHSIDVLPTTTSKLAVVTELSARSSNGEVLRIGDRGNWPGNDFELLASPFGLSVDQVSGDRSNCWNVSPAGLTGTAATVRYLDSMQINAGTFVLRGEPW